MEILLFQPEIPPNTGNVVRLCAATGIILNLVEPLGFSLEDRYLKRAGLDYWPHATIKVWPDLEAYINDVKPTRMVMTSARGGTSIQNFAFTSADILVFGPETRGLPPEVLKLSEHILRIPIKNTVRSLNLSTAVGIVLYQALLGTNLLAGW